MSYAQTKYQDKVGNGPYTIAQVGCFLTAFCNLLTDRFNKKIDPPSLNRLFIKRGLYLRAPEDGPNVYDDLGWASITAYDGTVHVILTGADSWPTNPNSIVKFYYQSISHPWLDASHTKKNMVTHFCLVADPVNHLIVDSWDGLVKHPGGYGEPVAWATYADIEPLPVIAPPPAEAPKNVSTENTYVLTKGDTIWTVAQRLGYSAQELMDHNAITPEQARTLPVGYIVHLPVRLQPPADTGVTYEVLDSPKQMHINKVGGAERWSFGNVKAWKDFTSTGHTPENTNVDIVAIAHVKVGEETAAYYMDGLAFGDYKVSGHVAYTVGYNWRDVADGYYVAPPPPEPVPVPEPPKEVPAPEVKPNVEVKPVDITPVISPNSYKATFSAFPQPELYIAHDTIMVHELDGRRPDKPLNANQGVYIGGTFTKDGVLYGRPKGAVEGGYWFAIPMTNLISEAELYNTNVDQQTRAAMHTLTFGEKVVVELQKLVSLYPRVLAAINKKQK